MRPPESFVAQPVRSLQTMLRVLREDAGQEPNVVPDGIYGQSTMDAVSAFQREHGLPVTGVTDQPTFETIVKEYEPALVRIDAAQPLQLIMNPNEVYRRGDQHPHILLFQAMLLLLAEIYGSIPTVSLTGIMDLATIEAISVLQVLSGLPQTGEMDKNTWKHLALQYPLAVNHAHSRHRIRR